MERINNSLINANIKLVNENKELKKEIERLNNIINELEKYINNEWNAIEKEPDNSFFDGYDTCIEEMKKDILDKIKELKGSDKE